LKENILEGPSIVWSHPIFEDEFCSRDRANRPVPAVTNGSVNIPCVERLKAGIKRGISLNDTQ